MGIIKGLSDPPLHDDIRTFPKTPQERNVGSYSMMMVTALMMMMMMMMMVMVMMMTMMMTTWLRVSSHSRVI